MTETTFALGDALKLTLELEPSRFHLAPTDLFSLAVRQNEKRAFLFVSKVLGKHLPLHPAVLCAAGKLLALAWTKASGWEYYASLLQGSTPPPFSDLLSRLEQERHHLQEGTLFVGFAETATGLARSVADSFCGEVAYLSTTRQPLSGVAPITFDESHSHARTHLLHLDPAHPFFATCRRAVLVDDELTTGNTALRLMEQLHKVCGIRDFVLMTLLDNSDESLRQKMADQLGITIETVCLLQSRIVGVETGTLPSPLLPVADGSAPTPILGLPDRPGEERQLLTASAMDAQRVFCRRVAQKLPPAGGDTLYLGTGEFIYLPALIAGLCGGTRFHSTTQSPVLPLSGSAITSGIRFAPPDCYSPAGYLYNVPHGVYRRAVIFAEKAFSQDHGIAQLTAQLRERGMEEVLVATL